MKESTTAYPMLCVMPVVILWGLTLSVHSSPDLYAQHLASADEITSDIRKIEGIYEATATILALVSFGSVLGVRLSTNRYAAGIQRGSLTLVFGGSLLVIIIQVLVMGGLCCGYLLAGQYLVYIMLTGMALIVMVGVYIIIVAAQNKDTSNRRKRSERATRIINKPNRKGLRTDHPKSKTGQPNINKPSTKLRAKARRTSDDSTSKGHLPPNDSP